MPIFEYEGKKYNVRDEHIDSFMKDFPDATSVLERGGKKYRVRSADYRAFMSEQEATGGTEQPEIASASSPATIIENATVAGQQEQPAQLTEQEKARMSAQLDAMGRSVRHTMDAFNERTEDMEAYRKKAGLGFGQTVEGGMRLNPQSGKMEQTYLTPAGNRYGSKALADLESFKYRQAADMSVGGQLRRAHRRLEELKSKREERAKEVHEEWAKDYEENKAPLAAVLAAQTYVPLQQSDRENSALDVAIRQTEELIKDLEEQKDREQGIDVGFWRGFGRVVGDFRTWDFGMSDLRDALTMMHAEDLKGENATEGEREAYDHMMGAIYEHQQADELYGGNASFWNRAGMMTGYMPSFMLDFALTGGGYDAINVAGKATTKGAVKVIGKEAVEQMTKQGFKSYVKANGLKGFGQYAGNWTIKALGTTADDLLIRAPLMTNTVQAGSTAADIIDRKLGDVVIDENGNYDFSNDKTWDDAVWQGEANAIIENYSEMFGAHLDPVMSLGNMSKLANVIGAKRLGSVLAKADADALGGIMGRTQQLFNKMGVSDYVGEVSEEYYGQLWRTMLNLDDAYQQNPDGTRTNLFATGQFHGDIWGGMALSMGLMGAGKATMTGAQYTQAKHNVNKADRRAAEMLGTEIWEPLRATLDLTTNENFGDVADAVVNDPGFTDGEKAAVLDYMERSMYMRGFNLGTMAKSRTGGQDGNVQQADESYIDGYNISSDQEMNDAKNLYDYHRQKVSGIVGGDEGWLSYFDNDPIDALHSIAGNEKWSEDEVNAVRDYINAKQVYDGMMQRVRDDIDGRIGQSDAMVDARVNRTTAKIQGAVMKQDDRKVYVVSGNLVTYDDGTGIDLSASDNSIIVRDAETGALEQVSPDAILSIDEQQDPAEQKEIAAQAIREQYAQEAADKIDGIAAFNPGDTYTLSGEDGQPVQVRITANEQGIVDNGDGTVNVTDGTNVFPMQEDLIQEQVDAQNMARVAEFEHQRKEEEVVREQAAWEEQRPQYAINDRVTLQDADGNIIHGQIADYNEADGMYVVDVDSPIDGKYAPNISREQLDDMVVEYNGKAVRKPKQSQSETPMPTETVENAVEESTAPTAGQEETGTQRSALERIPKDMQGQPIYEQADSDTAWDAIVEQTEGDEAMAQNVAAAMLADKEAELKKIEKSKPKGGISVAEKIAAERERKAAVEQARQQVDIWKRIAGTPGRRKALVEAERRRQAEEAAAQRRAEEERMRAEREEVERMEREALNGVPDIVDDTPQNARARGYRRVNGHKIDRQEPVKAVKGKSVEVKFSDNAIQGGRVAVIDAGQLQPSHLRGLRNPQHFIDEAQPKERNDEASIVSADRIAGNIRPEEITSSVTAYTGAPTVNARGEVIQGNNRSSALRQMWDEHPGQAERYRQYLKDHAEEFGLSAGDIDTVEHPVLVNMLDVEDNDAITLGQYVAQDTESGGTERIKPRNAVQRMGKDMNIFANLLLRSADDEASFSGLVDANGHEVLKWMSQRGFITPTQYRSAFDSKGNLTGEAKNDLKGIMYQSIFQNGNTHLEEMFNALPVKAQRAILSTAYRDYDSPNAERMIEEIQDSIRAYHALSHDPAFAEAKNFKDARVAVEGWKRQYQIDDVTGEGYLPADNFSNFALHLATMYKGESQGLIQSTFNRLFDLVQGTQEENLFEQPDNTPRTLVQAIKETLNIDYNGQQRSNVLAGDSTASGRRVQGGDGTPAPRGRTQDGNEDADRPGGTARDSGGSRNSRESGEIPANSTAEESNEAERSGLTREEALAIIASMEEHAEVAPEMELTIENWDAEFGEDGIVQTPIGEVKMGDHQYTKMMRQDRNGKLGMVKPTLENPDIIVEDSSEAKEGDTTERASSYVFVKAFTKADGSRYYYFTSVTVSKDGHEVVVSNQEKRRNVLTNLLMNGKLIWKHADNASAASDVADGLYSSQGNLSDPTTEGTDAPQTNYSESKGSEKSPITGELGEKVANAEAETDTNPTDGQKEAGNYKKGHVQIGQFDVSIENPKGSVRSGVDANGKKWEQTMHNTYGYIRGTEGVDGDHIDVFLYDEIDSWNGRRVFVIDQYNEDGTFDEHKVMLGFNDEADARAAYLANYESGWADRRKIVCSSVNIEEFEKWIDSSHRKTKPLAEYKTVTKDSKAVNAIDRIAEINGRISELKKQTDEAHSRSDIFEEARLIAESNELYEELRKLKKESPAQNSKEEKAPTPEATDGYTVERRYHKKNGTYINAVKFTEQMPRDRFLELKKRVKEFGGYYSSFGKGGFIFGNEEDAHKFANAVLDESGEQIADTVPISLDEIRKTSDPTPEKPTDVTGFMEQKAERKEANSSGNRLVTDERYEELKKRMRLKLRGQANMSIMGIDPEVLAIGTEMAVYHIEKGARKFAEYAKAMIADLGDVVRPYLKSFYNGARDLPEVVESGMANEMTAYDEVRIFDIANFDKTYSDPFATAETVVAEQDIAQKADEAKQEIISQRGNDRRKSRKDTSKGNEEKSLPENRKPKKKGVSSHIEGGLFDGLFQEGAQDNNAGETALKPGDRVMYKGKEATVYEIEDDGRLTLDTGLAPVMYEAADLKDVEPIDDSNNENEVHLRNGSGTAGRKGGHQPQQDEPLGTGAESEAERPDGRGMDRRDTARSRSDEERGGSVSRTFEDADVVTKPKNTRNNHSERGKNHAPTSVDARIDANIKAIELSQQIVQSGETATSEQMEVLRRFSGWGGLGKAFSDTATTRRLQELLGAEAYEQAVMSANSAYYTPAYVVDILWDIAGKMGFKGGNILEGSAGIGNILGQMPTAISQRSDIHAIEIDNTSGNILSLLYPDAKVEIQGFERTRIPNGSVDLAITNVPFVSGLRVDDTTGDKDLSKKFHNIHDFCIAKNVRKLREGGIGIFISSNGTLDSSKKLRDWIVGEGGSDFVGAFRLNNKTFSGASVTSDIIVIRKRVNGRKSPYAIDASTVSGERTADYDTGETRKVKGHEVPIVKHLAMDYNRYFIEHPENMAGEMRFAFEEGDTFRPTSKGLYPSNGKDQEKMLADFVEGFAGKEWTEEADASDTPTTHNPRGYVMDTSADGKKLGELYIKDGKLVIASAGGYYPLGVNSNKVKGHTKEECFNAYSAIKEALSDVLEYQTDNESDKGLKPLLDRLNKAYDDFVATYGHFNKNTAIAFLRNDVDYPNVFSLEKFEETGDKSGKRVQTFGKSDVFSKRVVEKEKEPTPTNVKDGIVASMFKFGRIDVAYIAEQLGESVEEVKHDIIGNGYGFENPTTKQVEVSYQYLSGNVREKLRQAEENNEGGIYDKNIKALQNVLPMDIPAHLIDFTLGSSWIAPKLYEDYVKERTDIDVKLTAVGGTWFMKAPDYGLNKEKNRSTGVYSGQFKKTIMGHTLIEAAIQNKTITVSQTYRKWDGSTETVTDKEATQACSAKIDEIRQDFKDWARQKMQDDADMSATMERIYNDMFNNYVPMEIPSEFVPEYFGGASHKFKMRPHQGKAIVRGTMQPLMLAHEVGTGKTFTLISTAMEMRRIGTARKPMIVVQNATVGQFVASAKELYPNAKILTLEEADRSAEGRKNFYAKIRYNDWDMIVVPQSTFDFIPDSEERQMVFIQDKIEEKMTVLEQMQNADPQGSSMITRQAKREIEQLQEQLAGLADESSKRRGATDRKKRAVALQNAEVRAKEMLDRVTDDVEDFDEMGIDALLVDEAHEYKHLGFATAMQRGVKGVDPSYSKKSEGLYLKVQAVKEKTGGRNVVLATGTPISNTAAEIWTFMRYLMPADTMKEYGIYYFDDFVRNFGNIQQMLEFSTNGKFKENNRFAGYVNLPELVRIWSGVTDTVRTAEAGGVSDKIPEMEGGKAQDIYLPQTRTLRSIMLYVKSELDAFEKMSGKEKKANSHIPLTMFSIAKAAAVDARLVQEDATDDPQSKTNEAVRQTLRSLKETADYKGTVAIFADNYQNKQSGFNLYEDIREKLVAGGVPEEQIVVMKSGMTVKKKLEIFDKVNRGEIRVILGSTFTLGTGVNIQERLHTLIHLDAPNRPMDYTQRNGRILRQGNLHRQMNKPVRILRFGVEDSLDVTAYQRLKTKGAIADSIMNGKRFIADSMNNRVLEEEEDMFGDTVAQLSGSEYAMLKNNAEKNVRKYESRKKQWEADQTYIHNEKPKLNALISKSEDVAKEQRAYLDAVKKAFPDGKFNDITVGGQTFHSVDEMADYIKDHNKFILEATKKMKEGGSSAEQTRNLTVESGGYTFKVQTILSREMARGGGQLFSEVRRKMTYSCPELGLTDVPVHQSLLRNAIEDIADNVITGKDFAGRAEAAERSAEHNRSELQQLLSREGNPFEFENELKQAREQLKEYSELMKKEMAEKEAKYAEMDASVEIASNVAAIDGEEDENMRESSDTPLIGEPADEMVSINPRAERREMARRVRELAEKLHLDNVEVVTTVSGLDGKKARAKGFYTKSTGKITVVIPNNTSVADAEQTLLHEAVAHYGLRQLFGKHFDTFLDNVFANADEDVRRRIVELSKKHGWDFRKATEEYLASLAERTNFEEARKTSWWQKIKDFFVEMLDKIGLPGFNTTTLSDNELRYILWRSYENLRNGGSNGVFSEAADIARQYELGVGGFAPNDDTMFRDGDPEIHERVLARDRYEQRVRSGIFQSREALQDSMLGLKEAMAAILGRKTRIEDVEGFENAYLGENRLSSVNKAEADAFAHLLFKPLLDEVARLARTEAQRAELTDYMMAKHGLERNRVMAERDAQKAFDENQKAHPHSQKTLQDFIDEYRQRDYAGLTALTGLEDVADAEAEALTMVADYEAVADTSALWGKVNAVSKAILQKSYDCGMMGKETFDSISAMYEYYIPLRGFDEKTSAEAYAYLNDRHSAFNAPIKKAEGRTSKADDPFANLQGMAESAISQGNRNKLVKQRFLNFVLNHPSDLASVSELWVQYDDVTDEWKPVFPDNIEVDDTPDEVERKMQDFDERMKQLAESEPDRYKKGRDAENIPYRVVQSNDLHQHQVVVKRGGRDYVITINGNPRAAQALNGLTNPDNDTSGAIGAILRAGERVNRQLSAFYTTRNPDFIVSNFLRDMLYTNSMVWIKESPAYALRFHRNYAKVNPVRLKMLLAKYRKGTLDMNEPTEKMFHQFMMNGGETGYANIRDIERHKNDIRRELKKAAGGKLSVRKAWSLLGERFDEFNRAVENCARFAAYMTSREMGRSLDRSIYDAKEISVNFNKKGSGAKFYDKSGQTTAGNTSALISGLGRSGYVFWNAAIQGTANFGRQAKRHPAKAFTGMAAMFLLGAVVACLGGDGDDDDDKNAYYNLPEYVRRSNILFRTGNSWVSIPLPVEYRAIYGMGELMMSAMNGKEHLTGGELAEAIAEQMSQMLPIDFLEGGGGLNAFVPSAAKPLWEAYVVEKSWTGMPLYKDTEWNKDMPEWTKAYSSANKHIVNLAAALNEATGGDPYTKGGIDFNPAKVEYLLNGYFGGVAGTIDKLTKTAETVFSDREYDPRSILLVNRVLKAGDERTEYRAVNNEYFRLKEEHDRLKTRLRHYEEDTDNGIFDYAEKIDFLYNSPEYERYEIFESYQDELDALYEEMKESVDDEERKEVEAELNELKKEMIQEMNLTRKRK